MGDGVNMAARLETQADVGGVLVSAQVYEQVVGKADVAFEDRGSLHLKGISQPVKAYAAYLADGRQIRPRPLAPPPDKPSIAVLPFENLSSEAEQEYFVDGLTEEITLALSGAAALFVIARNSSFSYKGRTADIAAAGRELGVRYTLTGSVRKAGNRLRVAAELCEAQTGRRIWSKRLDGTTDDIFEVQDEIAQAVMMAIIPSIQSDELAQAISKRPDSLTAYDMVLRATAALHQGEIKAAIPLLDQAIELSPDYAKALALRAWCNTLITTWVGEDDSEAHQVRGVGLARRALTAARHDPEVEAYAAYVLCFFGEDLALGFKTLRAAVERSPNFVWALVSLAAQEAIRGDPHRAQELCVQAERLNPRDPMAFRLHSTRALASWAQCDWAALLDHAATTQALMPNLWNTRAHVIVGLAELGRTEEMRAAARDFKERFPEFRLATHAERLSKQKNLAGAPLDTWLKCLRAAGLPD